MSCQVSWSAVHQPSSGTSGRPTTSAAKASARAATKPAAKAGAKAEPKAKTAAPKVVALTLVQGRYPAPLPPAAGEHAPLLTALHDLERAFLVDSKSANDVLAKEVAAIQAGKRPWTPAQASAVADLIGLDVGESPGNPDRTILTTRPQWKQQDREFEALGHAMFARDRVWALLLTIIGQDPDAAERWAPKVAALTATWHRDQLGQYLAQART